MKKLLTFVLVCSIALAQGGARCYLNLENDMFNCEMRYYAKVGPAQNAQNVEKQKIELWLRSQKEQCEEIFNFDVAACARKRAADKNIAEQTFSRAMDGAYLKWIGCNAMCGLVLLVPVLGEVVITPCAFACSGITSKELVDIKTKYDTDLNKIGIEETACAETAGAKKKLCFRLRGKDAIDKNAAEDLKFDNIEKPAFREKESCLALAKNTYDQCMARQP